MGVADTQTEFDFSEFDLTVSDEDVDRIIRTIDLVIPELRDQIDDEILDSTFRSEPPSYQLKEEYTRDRLQPEPFTQDVVIEPLLDALGYDDYGREAGTFAEGRGQQADYTVSLRNVPVDSTRLLIEAEPINKPLDSRGHGIDQVEGWLRQREFESDYGFATDGIRWVFIRYDPDSYTPDIIEQVDLRPVFLALFENATTVEESPESVIDEGGRELIRTLCRSFVYQNFTSIVSQARTVIKRKQKEITKEFYEDYIRVVFGVTGDDDDRRARSLIGEGIIAPDEADGDDVRLFAVDLMNRLLFIKFLEDKEIVNPDLLTTLGETYDEEAIPQTLYKTYFEPLFYEVFNKRPDDRSSRINGIEAFSGIPYLNGGLFRPELRGTTVIDERDFNVRNSVLEPIIDLLERYRFSADGGPTDIDPSILGNVFEKTINYLTTDPGDQNAELGAYYTPSEITRFCAEETVRPALLERFGQVLQEERDWPEAEVNQYETLYGLIDGLPGSRNLVTSLLADLDDFYVVDPGMGSGHFLTSVVEEVVSVRQALWAVTEDHPSRHRLKKSTVQNNIYGVDIMEPAVEIGKLRLWLSIISELREEDLEELDVETIALPNITFNIRQGNSLIGYAGFPEEAENGLATFERWTEDSVRSRYEDLIDEIRLYEEYAAFPDRAEEHRRRAEELLTEYRDELDVEILDDFRDVVDGVTENDLEEYTPYHWVLEFAEVYAAGGFDVIVGNPPWDRLRPTRDDYFMRHDEEFHSLLPERKKVRQKELLEDPDIREGWKDYQHEIEIVSEYFHSSGQYVMQTPEISGKTHGTENDLSALFLERVFQLAKEGGYVAQVLPGTIFNGASTKDLRMHLLNDTTIQSLVTFENKGIIFPEIHNQFNFGVVTFKNSGRTGDLRGIFQQIGMDVLQSFDEDTLTIPRSVLENYSPEAGIFPQITSQKEVDVLNRIIKHPPIGQRRNGSWFAQPYAELHRTNDADRFLEDPTEADYPVYRGENIYQFTYDSSYFEVTAPEFWSVEEDVEPEKSAKRRIREKNFRKLKRSLYHAFDGEGSQVKFVNNLLEEHRGTPLSDEDVLLDCTEYRIVFRDITKFSNERTIIAAVIPPNIVCTNTLHTVRPFKIEPAEDDLNQIPLHTVYDRIFSDESLFVALGLINSLPFDYLMRTKINTHIVTYKFEESQVPRLTEGDEWFEYIWRRSAKLNCYGEGFEEMRERLGGIDPATAPEEREEVQAELDAAAFHAYGLDREQTSFILDDFHRVRDPRRMTEQYFDLVLEKYEELGR